MPITLAECEPRVNGEHVLVTGGAGFIGSHLVDSLAELGARQITIIDNLSRPRKKWVETARNQRRIQFDAADILDDGKLEAALSGVHVIYHLAAIATVMNALQNPERTFAVNTQGTVRVAEVARRAGVKRLVFSSSREVYGNPDSMPVSEDAPLKPKNVYGASKAAAEVFLSTVDPSDIETVILRIANVYGTGDHERVIPVFLAKALQGRSLDLYGDDKALDFIWVEDVVRTLIMAGFSERPVLEPVNVGSGVATPLQDLALQIAKLTNSSAGVRVVPSRGPEVDRFQADLTRANAYFGLRKQSDPLDRLAIVLDEYRA